MESVTDSWTLQQLVAESETRLEALPPPKNGQVRAVPDERTIRYYAAIGLLDKPSAMRARTALYGVRHLAQVVAIKRMQGAGKSLAEIQALWPSLDDATLARISGVALPAASRAQRAAFWKRDVAVAPAPGPTPTWGPQPVEIRIELARGAVVTVTVADGVSIASADIRALREAAAPLATELAKRGW
jgi:DNA-binding transcriptional MerR regulator